MAEKLTNPEQRERDFNKMLVAEYLKYGSVDEVYRRHDYNLPISYPGYQRLLDRWGIVKSAGPNSTLSEAITFMTMLSDHKMPLETVYRKLPPSFKTSMATMHRILHNIKEGATRRFGTAVVVTREGEDEKMLVGEDISTPRLEYGKPYGSVSLPMTFSKMSETPKESVKRVLQQEVFTKETIENVFPENIIPNDIKPFMYFDIADINVAVFHLVLPKKTLVKNFSSFKLHDYRFADISEFMGSERKAHVRSGMRDIAEGYKKFIEGSTVEAKVSNLNVRLSQLAPEYLHY